MKEVLQVLSILAYVHFPVPSNRGVCALRFRDAYLREMKTYRYSLAIRAVGVLGFHLIAQEQHKPLLLVLET